MKNISFWKYQGCGNDFLIMDEIEEIHYEDLSKSICDRHFGIGGDGLILMKTDPLCMRIFNSDGSEATMCGNGIRCFIRCLKEQKHLLSDEYFIHTKAGIFHGKEMASLSLEIEIDMGEPAFTMDQTGLKDTIPIIDYPFYMHFHIYMITTMFIGTIHTVLFVSDADDAKWEAIGRRMHDHPFFQRKTNVNFVEVIGEHAIKVRTYEKGAGMTLACGSGACASAYCAHFLGFCQNTIEVYLKKGLLHMKIVNNHVLMRGPAQYIGKGIYEYKEGFAYGCKRIDR